MFLKIPYIPKDQNQSKRMRGLDLDVNKSLPFFVSYIQQIRHPFILP